VKPIMKVPLKYGTIGAGMIALMFFIFYAAGTNPLVEMQLFDFFILPVFLFFGLKEYRDAYNQRLMEFWQGMTVGFIVYFTIALLSSSLTWVFVQWVDSSLLASYIANSLSELDQKKVEIIKRMGEDTFLTSQQGVRATNIFDLALDSFLKKTAVGLLLTIMISVIMRRKP